MAVTSEPGKPPTKLLRPADAETHDGQPSAPGTDGSLVDKFGPALDALPGLARLGAGAWLHTAEWGVKTSAKTSLRVLRSVRDRDEAVSLAHDAKVAAVQAGQVAGAMGAMVRSVASGLPLSKALLLSSRSQPLALTAEAGAHDKDEQLRRRGAELLERSRDVWDGSTAHPAFTRILGELAPDEARLLLLLLQGGPQPSVDIRSGGPLGRLSSELLARNLTMIGPQSGVRYLDQVPAYINNLFRLGLIWFSPNPLRDPMEYQVLEAQPDVLEALHSARFARAVRRSIHLTPFGADFCRRCLVDEVLSGESFPEHARPTGQTTKPD